MITYNPCQTANFIPMNFGWSQPMYTSSFNYPKDTVLEYTLQKFDHALYFEIHYQHPIVKEILKNNKYQARNGMIIDISQGPELKDSLNTIYLRGANPLFDNRGDTTTFTHNFKRDNRYALVREAIAEFAAFVRKNAGFSVYSLRTIPVSNTYCFSW